MIDLPVAERFAADWIDAWNRHDLDAILAHYADDFDLSKVKAMSLGNVQRPANEVVDLALPWLHKVLELEPEIERWAQRFAGKQHALFLGRGSHWPVARKSGTVLLALVASRIRPIALVGSSP